MSEQEELLIKKTSESVFDILRKNGFEIKEKKSVFQRTEQLLYLMPGLKEAIKFNNKKIEDLIEYGLPKAKGKAVHTILSSAPLEQDEEVLVQKEISKIKQRNHIINSQIKWINSILLKFRSDKFYDIIDLKYFKNKTREDIAEYYECDLKTISRNKNRLINEISVLLFPTDNISELGI